MDKVVRYFGNPSEFCESDQWEPLCRLGQERMILGPPLEVYVGDIPPEDPPLPVRSPEGIQGIHFGGRISQSQFDILLTPLVNLTTLDIHLTSLSRLTLPQNNPHLTLDLLRNLQISSTNFRLEDAQNHDMGLVMENAMVLISYRFPLVKYFALSVPSLSSKESDWTSAIIRSLTRNQSGLKYLNIESPFSIPPPHHYNLKFECSRESLRDLKALTLTSFHYSAVSETQSTSFWREFSLGQSKLEYFHFWVQGHSPFSPGTFEEVLRNNRETVETVALNNLSVEGIRQGPFLNGRVLQYCSKLQMLYLMGDIPTEESGPSPRRPSFKDFNLLPYSLEVLRLHNLSLTMSETKFISNNLQNLTFLELVNVGEEGNLGMNLENLPTLLSKKKMEGVEVVRGWNKGTLQVTPQDRGWKNIAKILFQAQGNKTWFRAVRDPVTKTFEMVPPGDSEEEPSLSDDDTDSSPSSLDSLQGNDAENSTGKHEIHSGQTSRISNPNAKQLYANVNFNLRGTSSEELNHNES